MGNTASQDVGNPSVVSVVGARPDEPASAADSAQVAEAAPKKKICCACPETKKARDECIVENGEDACSKYIKAHKLCLRHEGFYD